MFRQIRDGDTANEAVHALQRLISCNYTNLQHYIEWAKANGNFGFTKNTRYMLKQYFLENKDDDIHKSEALKRYDR